MSRRAERLGGQIRDEVAKMVASDLKDPRLGFVTVTRVELTGDLRYARVYVGVLGEADGGETLTVLKKASGFVRREIGRRLRVRFAPEIDFRYDRGLEATDRVARALAEQVRIWKPVQQKLFPALGRTLEPDNAAFLHDPLTALSLLDDSALHFERLRVVPTVAEGVLHTLEVDPQLGIGSEMRVATRVDARAAERAITGTLLSN